MICPSSSGKRLPTLPSKGANTVIVWLTIGAANGRTDCFHRFLDLTGVSNAPTAIQWLRAERTFAKDRNHTLTATAIRVPYSARADVGAVQHERPLWRDHRPLHTQPPRFLLHSPSPRKRIILRARRDAHLLAGKQDVQVKNLLKISPLTMSFHSSWRKGVADALRRPC